MCSKFSLYLAYGGQVSALSFYLGTEHVTFGFHVVEGWSPTTTVTGSVLCAHFTFVSNLAFLS